MPTTWGCVSPLLRAGLFLAFLLVGNLPRLNAQLVYVSYTEQNLTDTTVGQDLWRYTYFVTGLSLEVNQGFSIFFDEATTTNLQSTPPTPNLDWSVISVQPDLGLNSDGFYDALALVDNPSFVGTFSINFVWTGTGTPGAQRFTVYDADFSTITEGQTTRTDGKIVNFSIRSTAGSGDRTLIVGFVVGGGSKPLLIRAIGPTLGAPPFNVPGVLADTEIVLYDSANAVIATNDDWGDAANFAELKQVSTQMTGLVLADDSKDSAGFETLTSGLYSVHCRGVGGTTGVALVEMYDTEIADAARLINVSARTQVGVGDEVLIAGFVVTGTSPRTVLIRGVGPRLEFYGVSGVLADPELVVYQTQPNTSSLEVGRNDDWSDDPNADVTAAIANRVSAFPLPDGSADAAIVLTLPPGLYTAVVRGKNNTAGIGLAEVYDVPSP